MKSKIIFLILHYKNIIETNECINSILKNIKYSNYNIVVVDNGSKNGTGEELEKKYKDYNNINIIINQENLGFANGNNVGFKYCKEKLKPDFIVMINSDTIITQEDFCDKIVRKYEEYKFDVCGIDILLPNGQHSNPIIPSVNNTNDIKREIKKNKILIKECKYNLDIVNSIINRIKTKHKRERINKNTSKDILSNDIQLHGAAIIFSKDYIKEYDGLYGGTFLYFEEVALRYICIRDNLKILYTPSIKILHKESKSTKMILKNRKKRHMFYYENVLNSATNLLNYIEKNESNVWKEEINGKKY